MPIISDELLQYCDNTARSCTASCTRGYTLPTRNFEASPCYTCLHEYHFKSCAESYPCERSCYYYIGYYGEKYAMEAAIAFSQLKHLGNLDVLSFGCGPATDLLALSCMKQKGMLKDFSYAGVDRNDNWRNIHSFYLANEANTQFCIENALNFIDRCTLSSYNVIMLHYVLSDMLKFQGVRTVETFLAHLFLEMHSEKSYPAIIINDIKSLEMIGVMEKILNIFPTHQKRRLHYFLKTDDKLAIMEKLRSLGFGCIQHSVSRSAVSKYAITGRMWGQLTSAQMILEA